MEDENLYKHKYLKYKHKYLELSKIKKNIMTGGKEKPTMYLFKADWCGHCNHFMGTWDKLQKNMKNEINFVTYDSDKHSNELKQWNIQGFPTIYLKKGNQAIEYTGEREINSLVDFIKSS